MALMAAASFQKASPWACGRQLQVQSARQKALGFSRLCCWAMKLGDGYAQLRFKKFSILTAIQQHAVCRLMQAK